MDPNSDGHRTLWNTSADSGQPETEPEKPEKRAAALWDISADSGQPETEPEKPEKRAAVLWDDRLIKCVPADEGLKTHF